MMTEDIQVGDRVMINSGARAGVEGTVTRLGEKCVEVDFGNGPMWVRRWGIEPCPTIGQALPPMDRIRGMTAQMAGDWDRMLAEIWRAGYQAALDEVARTTQARKP